jgi:hypothetical protein
MEEGILISGGRHLVIVCITDAAFGQEKATERAEIVENATAAGDMKIEFGEIVGDQQKRLFAAIRALMFGGGDFFLDFPARFFYSFSEHRDILMRAFDTIERGFGLVAHNRPFRPPAFAGGPSIKISSFSHK